ncbi:replication initiation protein RepM [Noviherbaspirillum sp. Root189]|uniref:replication initiation protein RepM n=1 Tax=Noviherbaspirillum sp. Root189 TaxID=1736487 RepID=UPI00070CB9DE|nr:replication initiation protein RepM [Noviherbaspirillum sp. Root189]KRB67016.1 Initiator RepB protein [Noviherbaspirillum sp. Root189]
MKKNELVVKSNRLVEASYRLGLNEQRIILYAICRCREEQKGLFPDLPVTITADSFAKQFPSIDKANVYRQLKEAMEALYERSVTIHDTDPTSGHTRVKKTRWVSEAAYVDGAGNVQVIFTPEVIKYVTRLEAEFTSYQLEKVGHMTSAHAVRIYELLAQHREIGNRTISLKWLRETLQMEADEYKLTADFIKRVIEPSVEQINKHSDLTVTYKPVKTGRAITDFAFKIKEKERKAKVAGGGDHAAREKLEALGQQRLDAAFNEEF